LQTSGVVCAIAFSHDGKEFAAIVNHHVERWDVKTWRLKSTSKGKILNCNHARFSPDLKEVATVGLERFEPGNFTIWSATASHVLTKLTAHQDAGCFIEPTFSHDGQLIAGGAENSVTVIWNVAKKKMLWSKFSDGITMNPAIAFTRDDSKIVESGRNIILIRDVKTGDVIRKINIGENSEISCLDISPDDSTIVVNQGIYDRKGVHEQYIDLINTHSGKWIKKIRVNDSSITFILFSPDGRSVITGDEANSVNVWSTQDGSLVEQFTNSGKELQQLAVSPDGKQIVCVYSGGGVRVWQMKSTFNRSQTRDNSLHAAFVLPRARDIDR
jgi:WD40 repeat protein